MEAANSRRSSRWWQRASWLFCLGWTVALAGCSQYVGTTAASFLRRAREDPDPNVRYLAYAKLGSPNCYDSADQKREAVRILSGKLEDGREPIASRAVILRTLGELRDPSARPAVLKMVNDPEPVIRIAACRALGKVGAPEDATLLAQKMTTDTLEDARIAAIEALGDLKPDDSRILRVLVAGLMQDDPATRLASLDALRAITGKDLGVEAERWLKLVEEPAPTAIVEAPAAPAPPVATAPANYRDPSTRPASAPSGRNSRAMSPSSQPAASYPPVPRPIAPR